MRWRRRPPTPLPQDPDCHQVAEVLESYLDGELGPQDAEAVAAHLEFCEFCGIQASKVQAVVAAIRRQRPDLDPELRERMAGFIDGLADDGPPTPR
jgi:anti-sigma factor (TIGR02949 family)